MCEFCPRMCRQHGEVINSLAVSSVYIIIVWFINILAMHSYIFFFFLLLKVVNSHS